MFPSGPLGFHNAPITKFVLLVTSIFSIIFSNIKMGDKTNLDFTNLIQFWRLFSHHSFFQTLPEIMFGLLLIYHFRLFERQMGSAKFGGFLFVTLILSTLFQLAALVILPTNRIAPGPYFFIYSCFVLFYKNIPSTYPFRICGINTNDKLFTYILGLNLICSNYPGSIISGICGLLAGIFYRSEVLQLNKFQFPLAIRRFFSKYILPFLQSSPVRTPPSISSGRTSPSHITRSQLSQALLYAQQQQVLQSRVNDPSSSFVLPPSEESIQVLIGMGFSRDVALDALARSNNNLELATDLLLEN